VRLDAAVSSQGIPLLIVDYMPPGSYLPRLPRVVPRPPGTSCLHTVRLRGRRDRIALSGILDLAISGLLVLLLSGQNMGPPSCDARTGTGALASQVPA